MSAISITRRGLAGLGAAALAGAPSAWSQSFPSRPIRLIVPYPPGGPTDLAARLVAQGLAQRLGQNVVVENRAGGNGVVGTDAAAKALADGFTITVGNNQTHVTNKALIANLPYDPIRDFAPLAVMVTIPAVLVVHPAVPAQSVAELIALAKAQPSLLSYGSTGNGSASHLTAELFRLRTGVAIEHVPYRGTAQLTTDLLSNRVQLSFATLPSVLQQVQAGSLRVLAATGRARAPQLPEVKTLSELGVPVEAESWLALFTRAGTAPEITARLSREIMAVLDDRQIQEGLAQVGFAMLPLGEAEARAFLQAETLKWNSVVAEAKVTFD